MIPLGPDRTMAATPSGVAAIGLSVDRWCLSWW